MDRNRYPTKGPGDLWLADSRSDGYYEDDAHADIASRLVDAEEVAELVGDVRAAAAALHWISHNVDMPDLYRRGFRLLCEQERKLSRMEDDYARAFATGEKTA